MRKTGVNCRCLRHSQILESLKRQVLGGVLAQLIELPRTLLRCHAGVCAVGQGQRCCSCSVQRLTRILEAFVPQPLHSVGLSTGSKMVVMLVMLVAIEVMSKKD